MQPFPRNCPPTTLLPYCLARRALLRMSLAALVVVGWLGSPLLWVVVTGRGVEHQALAADSADLLYAQHALPAALNQDAEVVYLDAAGYIRIWDPQPPASESEVTWVSPEGGWRAITLADVNQDGDLEIVAVGGEAYSGRLVIYDPVMTTGKARPGQITNKIPWAILFDGPLPGRPLLVQAGELNSAVPGPELAFVYELNPEDKTDSDDKTRLALWQAVPQNGPSVDGTAWTDMGPFVDVGAVWNHLALGDLDNTTGDEIVVVDDDIGFVRVYRLEKVTADGKVITELKLFYENRSSERPWLDGTVARFVPSPLQQLALARASGQGGNTLWVLYYDGNETNNFGDSYAEFMLPAPRTIFAGDVDNNGDDELFLLRGTPNNIANQPRLIMRNYEINADPLPVFEQVLDADNGYTAGTTGDIDGDGRAEVIVMRNNHLRAYTSPETGVATALEFTPPVTTNQRVVTAGNLDRNGYVKIPELGVAPPQINSFTVYMGETRTTQLSLSTLTSGAEGPIPFVVSLPDAPSWLTVTPLSGETAAELTVRVDASALTAGTYESTIVISSPDLTVDNSPFVVNIAVEVLPGLIAARQSISAPLRCSTANDTFKQSLALAGPAGLTFSAAIVAATDVAAADLATVHAPSAPDVLWPSAFGWVSASSPNVLPTTMELTFHGDQVAAGAERGSATLQLVFYDNFGRQSRTVDIAFFCADRQLYLPLIRH